ncbi:hypothetical protein AVEN_266680-1 [Araneus ventricosus]|uniref:Uncharacterized protein n=1 Tax=Araneus ventricosus TaxID=182803 RepID=A0A4Y2NEC6_ARAVE|nr:hypothetical protein AVEN_266680-1 [Araneus ventricosus]
MHREQYTKKKETGKVKPISKCSDREKRKIRKDWRKGAKKYRESQKLKKKTDDFLNRDTSPMTPEPMPVPSNVPDPVPLYESPMYLLSKRGVNKQESEKKKVKQGKEKMKKQIKNLEKKIEVISKNEYKTSSKTLAFQ